MKKGKQGIHSILAVADRRLKVAEDFFHRGKCQVQDCPNPAYRVVEFFGNRPLSLCKPHANQKGVK